MQHAYTQALGIFHRYQSVFERLTEMDRANAGWRRELAEARRRTGD
ncbi:MAG TPA: hypothetical protein VFW50_15930 [Streptosporangiaceae bacterium]|nr:hypothetical protein [Streptosporangiaceae bacterium]